MGFAFKCSIQLWSILVDILWGQVSEQTFQSELPALFSDAGGLWSAIYLSSPGCLTAFRAGQSFITVSSGSDSFLFSVLTELHLYLSFIPLTSYLASQWFKCMSYFLYYMVRAVLDSFPIVLALCLIHSRSSIYFKKVMKVGSKFSKYCFPYFISTISAFLLLTTIHVGGMSWNCWKGI